MAKYVCTTSASSGRFTSSPTFLRTQRDPFNPLFDGTLAVTIGGHNVTAVLLSGLSYSSSNPGGFGECSFQIEATSPHAAYVTSGHTVAKGDAVTMTHAGTVLFEGVITGDVSHAVINGGDAYYDATCAGLWWLAGQRKDFCQTWSDDDYGQWFQRSGDSQAYTVSTEGEVKIMLEKGGSCATNARASLYYWLNSGLGDTAADIDHIISYLDINVTGADWYATVASAPHPWSTSGDWVVENTWNNEVKAAGTPYRRDVTAGHQCLRLRLYTTAAVATSAADRYIRVYRLSVIPKLYATLTISSNTKANPTQVNTSAAHGLKSDDRVFIYGTNSSPDIDGWRTATYVDADSFTVAANVSSTAGTAGTVYVPYRIDEAMAAIAGGDAALTTGLSASSDLQTGGIGNVSWGLNVRPHMSRAEAIEAIASAYVSPIDYGFWDSAAFYCKERIAAAGTHDILIDSEAAGIDFDVFKDVENSPSYVKVLYKFRDVDGGTSEYADGTQLAAYWPSVPTWADASLTVDVWEEWSDVMMTTTTAESIAYQILKWIGDNVYVGTITVATPTVPLRSGGWKYTSHIRAGDYIEDTNLDTGELMVTSMSMDVDSGVATLGIGENRRDFVARMNAPRIVIGPGRPGTL
jgi:hypothetical protein